MTLRSGHPRVVIPGHADGDADDADSGLRGYLVRALLVPKGAVDGSNGSEFYVLSSQTMAVFGLYWYAENRPEEAYFKLRGSVKEDADGLSYFQASDQDIVCIDQLAFVHLLKP